jgi:hypothetical protein
VGVSLELMSSRPMWAVYQDLISRKNCNRSKNRAQEVECLPASKRPWVQSLSFREKKRNYNKAMVVISEV